MCWNICCGSCSSDQVHRVRGCKSSISTKSHLPGHSLATDLNQTCLLSLSNRSCSVLFVSVNHAYKAEAKKKPSILYYWAIIICLVSLAISILTSFTSLWEGHIYLTSVFSWGDSTQIFSGTTPLWIQLVSEPTLAHTPCADADAVSKSKEGKTFLICK